MAFQYQFKTTTRMLPVFIASFVPTVLILRHVLQLKCADMARARTARSKSVVSNTRRPRKSSTLPRLPGRLRRQSQVPPGLIYPPSNMARVVGAAT